VMVPLPWSVTLTKAPWYIICCIGIQGGASRFRFRPLPQQMPGGIVLRDRYHQGTSPVGMRVTGPAKACAYRIRAQGPSLGNFRLGRAVGRPGRDCHAIREGPTTVVVIPLDEVVCWLGVKSSLNGGLVPGPPNPVTPDQLTTGA